ncbi:MAG TPA: Gfo/Idh/MocA family oxidoreductase [Actinopolymorphaceae bacterium]|jgi:predicted dehydrogenase
MPDRLKVGVVGLGLWGQNHPLVYDDYDRCELAVVCDLDEERARKVASTYRCEWTTDVRELAASDVTTFSVATPDHAHFEPTRVLLEAGKNVLVEKPLTTDLAEAKALTQLAEQSDGKSMVDYHLRWAPNWCLVKDAVEQGELGKPVMGYIRLNDAIEVAENWLSWAGQSGPHWFLFPHTMDLVRWIIGQEPRRVFAAGHRGVLQAKGVDTWDCIQAIVEFDSCHVTFETSWIVPNGNPSVLDCHASLYGDKGKIDLDQDYSGIAFVSDTKTSYPWVPLGKKDRWGRLDHYMYAPMRYFVDCVLDDRTPECPLRDGLVGVAMIHAVVRSLETGQPVDVQELLA